MKIERLNYGGLCCNVYVLGEEGGPCLVIDPGFGSAGKLQDFLTKHHSQVEGVLLSHGHFDHIGGIESFDEKIPVFLHQEDGNCFASSHYNVSYPLLGQEITLNPPKNLYLTEDEDEIALPSFGFKVIHTPFHTQGSVCFYFEKYNLLFTGDTLFHFGIGRTDLPGGNSRQIEASLRKLETLPPETKIYPGHDSSCLLGEALRNAKGYY